LPFAAPIDPSGILEPADKVRVTRQELTTHGLSVRDCVAYGDSMSDGPLFSELENTVAVNADQAIEQLAAVAYRGESLVEAYALGRSLLDRDR
jgi:phosphoserine phosphatase